MRSKSTWDLMLVYLVLIPLLGSIGVLFSSDSEKSKKFALFILTIICLYLFVLVYPHEFKEFFQINIENLDWFIYLFVVGFILSNLIFIVLTEGWLGKTLQFKVKNLLEDSFLFNFYFFIFCCLYLSIIFSSPIYL